MQSIFSLFAFFACTALVALVSWWFTRRTDNTDARSYFLADRRLSWSLVAGSLLLTNLSTEQLIGLNGAASLHGAVVIAWEIMPVFALLGLAWWFLPRYWSGNFTTVPEFLENRFDRTTRRLMGVIFLITIAFNTLPFVLFSGSVALSSIFRVPELLGIPLQSSVLLIAAVIGLSGVCYVIFGGMKAVAVSDMVYGAGLLLAGLLIPWLALRLLGDGDVGAGLARIARNQGARLNPIGEADSNVPFTTIFTGMLFINFFYWCTNQTIVQRSFGASSFAEAQKGILATAGLKLLGPLYLVLPGIIATEIFGAAIGNGDLSYGKLVELVLPDWLQGFFAAVLFGSIISAFNGALHSAVTVFSLDLYRSWFRPRATDGEMLTAGKRFAFVMGLVAIITTGLLHDSPEGVFTLMKRFMAAFKLPLLAVVVIGMIFPRVPAWSAKLVLVGGVATQLVLDWLLGYGTFGVTVHWLHLAGINTVILAGVLALAGLFSKTPVPASHRGDPRVRLSHWPGLPLATAIVSIVAVAIYVALWSFARA
jgi:SSS family solute:Na+ symporter